MARTEQESGLDLPGSTQKLTEDGKNSLYGSDPESNGRSILGETQVDKYGFSGGAQQFSGNL